MATKVYESSKAPISAPNSSLALSSGVATATLCSKFIIYFSVAGNLTIRTADQTSVTINSVAGLVVLDVSFDMLTWTGTATAAGFYNQ